MPQATERIPPLVLSSYDSHQVMAAHAALKSPPKLWDLPGDVEGLGNDLIAAVVVLVPLIVVHDL